MKFSKKKLKQLEDIFKAQGYSIRYEKGNFHSGYCIVKEKNIIVINKFFQPSARFECLQNIAESLHQNESMSTAEVYDIALDQSNILNLSQHR